MKEGDATETATWSVCGRNIEEVEAQLAAARVSGRAAKLAKGSQQQPEGRLWEQAGSGGWLGKKKKAQQGICEKATSVFREMIRRKQVLVDHDATSKAMGGQPVIPGQGADEKLSERLRNAKFRRKPKGRAR